MSHRTSSYIELSPEALFANNRSSNLFPVFVLKLGNLTSALLYFAGSIEPHRREGMMPGSIENVMISSPFVSNRSAIAAMETA